MNFPCDYQGLRRSKRLIAVPRVQYYPHVAISVQPRPQGSILIDGCRRSARTAYAALPSKVPSITAASSSSASSSISSESFPEWTNSSGSGSGNLSSSAYHQHQYQPTQAPTTRTPQKSYGDNHQHSSTNRNRSPSSTPSWSSSIYCNSSDNSFTLREKRAIHNKFGVNDGWKIWEKECEWD